jgi:hypothetical protein
MFIRCEEETQHLNKVPKLQGKLEHLIHLVE